MWVPATERVKPVTAHQWSLGYNQLLGKKYTITLDGYYKLLNNQIQYKQGSTVINTSQSWEDKVAVGQGWAYGAELMLEKRIGDLTGWIGYTLSWSERQFDELNNGEKFPYTYDRRHDVSLVATYQLNERWDFGVTFVFGTGKAVSLATHYFSNNNIGNFVFNDNLAYLPSVNNYRMPAYHRLDISANRTQQKKWGESIWSFSIYNVYSRQNPYFIFVGEGIEGQPTLKQVAIFPLRSIR